MKVSVFGLGYVGIVAAACLRARGHEVIGVDVVESKIAAVNSGQSPVREPGVNDLLTVESTTPRVRATSDYAEAVRETSVAIVCVGTPALPSGHLELAYLERVLSQIYETASEKTNGYRVVNRSSVVPGTHAQVLLPLINSLDAAGRVAYSYHPEFLREGESVKDFNQPALHVCAATSEEGVETVNRLFPSGDGGSSVVDFAEAEMLKYASNAFHALKVAFSGEVAAISTATGADATEVLRIFRSDHRLNISEAYLRPGFAFGGSCLPKDTYALAMAAEEMGVETPLIESIIPSNDRRISSLLELVESHRPACVGIWGVAFKPATDDVRGSPLLRIIEALVSHRTGYSTAIQIKIYDSSTATNEVASMYGDQVEPTDDAEDFVRGCDVVILGTSPTPPHLAELLAAQDVKVIDLGYFHPVPEIEGAPNYRRY